MAGERGDGAKLDDNRKRGPFPANSFCGIQYVSLISAVRINYTSNTSLLTYSKGPFYSTVYSPQLQGALHALQRNNTENSVQIFPEKESRGDSPNFPINVCERFIYSHDQYAYSAAGNMWTDPVNI